jgi:hypothetical protein
MKCRLCLGCFDQRRYRLGVDDLGVKGFMISGSEIRPIGLRRLAPTKTIDHYLSMSLWEIKRADQWEAIEWQPKVVLYAATKDGRPISFRAGPYDEIGLFGSTVTFLRTEESLLPLTEGAIPLMDLTEFSTPPTPPMTD